jgi:hypothetical protein
MAAKKPSKRTKKLMPSKRLEKKQTLTSTSRFDPYKTYPMQQDVPAKAGSFRGLRIPSKTPASLFDWRGGLLPDAHG